MVGRVDDPGVVEKTAPLHGLQDPTDAVIDHGDVAVVEPADVGDNGIGQVRRIAVHVQEVIQELPERPVRRQFRPFQRARHRHLHIPVQVRVLCRGVPRIVRTGEAHPLEERLRVVVLLDPPGSPAPVPGVDVVIAGHRIGPGGPQRQRLDLPAGEVYRRLRIGAGTDPLPVGVIQAPGGQVVGVLAADPDRGQLAHGLDRLREAVRLHERYPLAGVARPALPVHP